ncbi:MAG: Helix-turn-helix domain [Candidatus Atelocyanobacterium thalassa isolate SIO64986]|uniref:Helix-turn-helix domain n=1 Tax=Candidatus Atelocyanobacterium thalassa isolate SIO64986 TaxID=1527444 RepID=A0A086CFS3_9CHRO|nr:MAG: Helix-turn-helix domain [Candidatus Atelocyanobacterium thalassa isolate SIO64986]
MSNPSQSKYTTFLLVKKNKMQEDTLREIGNQLFYARKKKGLKLISISQKTSIPIYVLKAIENGHLNKLSEIIYTKNLIRKFANCLDLDGQKLVAGLPVDSLSNITSKSTSYSQIFSKLLSISLKPLYCYFIYIFNVYISINIILTVFLFFLEKKYDNISDQITVNSLSSGIDKSNIVVKVSGKGESTLKVIVDNHIKFNGLFNEKIEKVWQGEKSIIIETDNAGLLLVGLKHQKPTRLGRLRENKTVIYEFNEVNKSIIKNLSTKYD